MEIDMLYGAWPEQLVVVMSDYQACAMPYVAMFTSIQLETRFWSKIILYCKRTLTGNSIVML